MCMNFHNFTRVSLSMTAGILATLVSACGSSASDGSNTSTVFSDPVDSSSLRQALITGSTAVDTEQYWLCSVGGDNRLLEYRLFADKSGTETDQSNPTLLSQFSWETVSATSMNTTVATNGMTINFTDIQFSGRNAVNLSAGEQMLSCSRQGELPPTMPLPQPATNTLTYSGVKYALTHGFIDSFFYPTQPDHTHAGAEYSVANAAFDPLTISGPLTGTFTQYIPNRATVWLYARLYSPGGFDFQSATFDYVPDSTSVENPLVAGRHYFREGSIGIDANGDGEIQGEDNEYTRITAGTITIEQLGTETRMSFAVSLADGVQVTGSYTGIFPVFTNL